MKSESSDGKASRTPPNAIPRQAANQGQVVGRGSVQEGDAKETVVRLRRCRRFPENTAVNDVVPCGNVALSRATPSTTCAWPRNWSPLKNRTKPWAGRPSLFDRTAAASCTLPCREDLAEAFTEVVVGMLP